MKTFLAIWFWAASAVLFGQNFEFQHPRPTSNHVNDMVALDANTWLLFCDAGAIIRTTDRGETWTTSYPDDSLRSIYEASFVSSTTGFACGLDGLIMKTTDAGVTWYKLGPGTAVDLWYIDFVSPDTGIVGGSSSTARRTTDGGATWHPITVGGTSALFYKIHYVTSSIIYIGTGSATPGRLMKSTDGGDNWLPVAGYTAIGTVRGIFFIDPDTGWVSDASYAIYKTTDAGATWFSQGDFGTGTFYEVKFFDPLKGIAAGANGTVRYTTNGGANWDSAYAGYNANLYSLGIVGFFGEGTPNVVVAGEHGVIASSENYGATWNPVSTSVSQEELRAIQFIDANTGYAAGGSSIAADSLGQILKTTDAGETWALLPPNPKHRIYAMDWLDAMTGYVATRGPSGVFKTTDGGATFTMMGVGVATSAEIWYGLVAFGDTVYASGSGNNMVRTVDGGATWSPVTTTFAASDIIYKMHLFDGQTVIAVGSGGKVRKTTDGGVSWISGTNTATNVLYDVNFVDALTGYACGTTGTVRKTTDGGLNWFGLTSGTTSTLYDVQFSGADIGFFGGLSGVSSRTTDGGTTWMANPLLSNKDLWEMDAMGGHVWVSGESGTILHGTYTVPGFADIDVDPTNLDFGILEPNTPDTLSFTITSTGTDTLHVTDISVGDPEFTVLGPTTYGLANGEYVDVSVVFESASTGVFTDVVTITSNAVSGTHYVSLEADVAVSGPSIAVVPDTLNFSVIAGAQDSASYWILNEGTDTLLVSSIDAEEILPAGAYPTFAQPQQYTPHYAKGANEPTFGPVVDGQGGPDPFGYVWIDSDEPGGPAYVWNDISGTGIQATTWTSTGSFDGRDEGYAGPFNLGFSFHFYGQSYSQVFVSSNGMLLFAAPTEDNYSNAAIPTVTAPNDLIASFWDDLDGSVGGTVHYQADPGKFTVQYTNWPRYSDAGSAITMQMVLYANGKVEYYYNTLTATTLASSTVGMENVDGTMGTQIAYNSAYVHNNLAVRIQRVVEWLSQSPAGGAVAPGDSLEIQVNVNAADLIGGSYHAKAVIASNDPMNSSYEFPIINLNVTGIPDIGVAPSALDFGELFINATDTLNYTVTNTGTDQLNVTDMTHTAGQFTLLGPTTFSLGVGEDHVVPVVFSSPVIGAFADTVVITSNGAGGTQTVALAGEAIALPDIEVDTLLALGPIGEGEEDSTSFWIHNRGLSDLEYSILEGEDMFSSLGFSRGESSAIRVRSSRPVVKAALNVTDDEVVMASGHGSQTYSQTAEVMPEGMTSPVIGNQTDAQWDVQFAYDANTVTGAAGNAAALYANGEFWTSRWASNILHRWNPDGTLIEQFTIAGVTGIRGLTWDGTYIYAGINTAAIQIIDQATRTLVGTIATSGAGNVRFISYDPVRDGFWVGNFTGNIFCVNRSGSVIATMATTLAGKYGSAYDPYSAGGPYLWVWDQLDGQPTSPQYVHQFDLNSLTATGVTFNITSLGQLGPGIAGGLFISDELVPGTATLGGMLQGNPGSDMLFGLELTATGLSWLDVWPAEGTIAAGDSAEITVYMHGIMPEMIVIPVDGYLGIASNDPDDPMVNVHVTMDIVVGVDDPNTANALPAKYALHTNYPNPFNPTTTIKYDLKEAGTVSLKVYNILGQEVRTLVNAKETAGFKVATWDGRNNAGQTVASGLYIYRLETEKFTKSRKMMLLK